MRSALEALSVLRPDPAWFNAELAQLLIGSPDSVLLKELVNAGLIEVVRYTHKNGQEGHTVRYTMHRIIAEYIRSKLPQERLQTLNHRAADYYLEKLTALERSYQEGGASSYDFMYRYEDFEWQNCQDNWLYYFAQTGYDLEANLSFLRVWFDGFWWWNCFTAEGYDFCNELLADWEYRLSLTSSSGSISPSLNQDRVGRIMRGLELLHIFKRAYPKETEPRSSSAWSEVIAALVELRKRVGLDDEPGLISNPQGRHVRALTDIFLAEAARFGHADISAAEALYREALALFRESEETWNIAWTLYHLADMLASNGHHTVALPLALEAVELGAIGGDYEVGALTHRVLGDIALVMKNPDEALSHYQQAIELAYRFQVQPEDPDLYTVQFFADLADVVARRLQTSYATLPEEVRGIANRLRQAWLDVGAELAPLQDERTELTAAAAAPLARHLFPAPLPLDRFKADKDAYAAQARALLGAIDARITQVSTKPV